MKPGGDGDSPSSEKFVPGQIYEVIRDIPPDEISEVVGDKEGMTEEEETSLSRELGHSLNATLFEVKKYLCYTLGVCLGISILFVFGEGINLTLDYVDGVKIGKPNKELGDYLSSMIKYILVSMSSLFLKGLFPKK